MYVYVCACVSVYMSANIGLRIYAVILILRVIANNLCFQMHICETVKPRCYFCISRNSCLFQHQAWLSFLNFRYKLKQTMVLMCMKKGSFSFLLFGQLYTINIFLGVLLNSIINSLSFKSINDLLFKPKCRLYDFHLIFRPTVS